MQQNDLGMNIRRSVSDRKEMNLCTPGQNSPFQHKTDQNGIVNIVSERPRKDY